MSTFVLVDCKKFRTVNKGAEEVVLKAKTRTVKYFGKQKETVKSKTLHTQYYELAPRAQDHPAIFHFGNETIAAEALLYAIPKEESPDLPLILRVIATGPSITCK